MMPRDGRELRRTTRQGLRVALVRGPVVSTKRAINNEAVPSIGLAYLAGYLRHHNYEVTLVDATAEGLNRFWDSEKYPGYVCQGLTFHELIERIPASVDVIGFSAMFSGEWPVQRDLITEIRQRFPHALIIAGGEHINTLPEYSLQDCPALDVCVRGEGEQVCYELLECVRQGHDYTQVRGICYRAADGTPVIAPPMPRIRDLDTIPWPYWPEGYLEKFWSAGKSYGVCTERDMPLLVSRGCPYECTFCSNPQMWTRTYWLRDPDDVIAEIKHYKARYQITSVQLYDLTAITKKSWTVTFCKKLLEHQINLKWSLPSGTRSEALDRETLSLLKQTGCNYLVYAPESGSPNTLQRIKKLIDLSRLTSSVLEAKRQGLVLRTNLIVGFPHESRRDIFLTIWYGLKLAIRGVDEVSINVFSPYPGSEIFKQLEQQNRVHLGDAYFLQLTSLNSDYTSLHPLTVNPVMGPRELALYRIGFMMTNYLVGYLLRPRRIWRTLRNLASRNSASTVFEHRLKDALKRMRQRQKPKTAYSYEHHPVSVLDN